MRSLWRGEVMVVVAVGGGLRGGVGVPQILFEGHVMLARLVGVLSLPNGWQPVWIYNIGSRSKRICWRDTVSRRAAVEDIMVRTKLSVCVHLALWEISLV